MALSKNKIKYIQSLKDKNIAWSMALLLPKEKVGFRFVGFVSMSVYCSFT